MKAQTSQFNIIFTRLRAILESHASRFVVSADGPNYYCLDVSFSPRFKKSFPIAWVKISKSYVSFHFMPVYFSPALQESLSPELKARMQGKSCFNFTSVDTTLLEELERFTARGFALSKKANVL